jgi:signal transduction histidine kinase
MIDGCINQANKIVNDLLEYSRVMKLELTKVDADEILRIALNELNIPNNVKIELQLNASAKIVADEEKINRLFLNIIKNAFDAMPNGGTLTINTQQTTKKLDITFTDTGAGMSKELLKKLGNPLLTTKAKGMGFGIPICKRIIVAHGGKLLIDSTIGKGTKINIALPVKPKNVEKDNINLIVNNVQMEKVASSKP